MIKNEYTNMIFLSLQVVDETKFERNSSLEYYQYMS